MAAISKQTKPLRILLIGRTGDGKSSTGNTILGSKQFRKSSGSQSETKKSEMKASKGKEKPVEVVDTPGFFDTDGNQTNILVLEQLIRALLMTTPGFHVIAFVLKREKITPEIQCTLDIFFNFFGANVENHAFVILTHTDTDKQMKKFIEVNPHEMLTELVTKCKNRIVCLNNKGSDECKESQLQKLFEMVDTIDDDNGGQCFSNTAYELAAIYAKSKNVVDFTTEAGKQLIKTVLPWTETYLTKWLCTLNGSENEENALSELSKSLRSYEGSTSCHLSSESYKHADPYKEFRKNITDSVTSNFMKGLRSITLPRFKDKYKCTLL